MKQASLHSKEAAIGVFDSGLGGLTVLAALAKAMPQENFIYLGDTARVPYGSRSAAIVQRYSLEDAAFLCKKNLKMLVIACNTAAAYAEELIARSFHKIPVMGVIQAGVDALFALDLQDGDRVAVLGTKATIKSGVYTKAIMEKKKSLQVLLRPCPLFVPLVEEGWMDTEISRLVIRKYLHDFAKQNIKALVLGCTHYPLLKKDIQREFPELPLIDSSQASAKLAKSILGERNMLSAPRGQKAQRRIYLTDMTASRHDLELYLGDLSYDSIEEVRLN